MKATISYEGVCVECDDVSPKELQELIFAIKDGPPKKRQTVCDKAEQAKRGRPKITEVVESLNVSQLQTWQYLLAHDCDEGISATQYAKEAKIAHPVADNRLRKLLSLGMAHKIAPGRYRSGPGESL